jgi:hypothetical protein
MSGDDILKLSDDAPKQDPWRDDRLGFKPFAERLSTVIGIAFSVPGQALREQGLWQRKSFGHRQTARYWVRSWV